MNKVKSKYKNPDKYVERLKVELARTRRYAHDNSARMGIFLFDYTQETEFSLSSERTSLGVFRTGDTVIITGTIGKVVEDSTEGSNVQYRNITVRRKESQ